VAGEEPLALSVECTGRSIANGVIWGVSRISSSVGQKQGPRRAGISRTVQLLGYAMSASVVGT
jgi:hypothetical protein